METTIKEARTIVAAFVLGLIIGGACLYKYTEKSTLATVYKVQLDKCYDIMKADMKIVNSLKGN